MENKNKYLPLGTVVGLKDAKYRFMIVGRQREFSDGQKFDYVSFIYPYGYIDDQKVFMFNAEDISKIFYIGYQDVYELEYQKRLAENAGTEGKE